MRINIIIPGGNKSFESLSREIEKFLKQENIEVEFDLINSENDRPGALSARADLIIAGSPLKFPSGEISGVLRQYINRQAQMEGKRIAIFVNKPLLGSSKGLKSLMNAVEERGSIIVDFEAIGNKKQAAEFARRLLQIR